MSQTVRCIVLIIRLTVSLTLILIWIMSHPQQITAGG